jgi:tRNA threonylcarbamoyladenosine biosynthesis protein TsaE
MSHEAQLERFLADADATERLGRELAACMPQGAVLGLRGELGAGKSTIARASLRALGVTGAIKSPTYTLVEQYPVADGMALHLDLYRIVETAELEFLGLADLAGQARCWLVEWPERGGLGLPPTDLELHLAHSANGRHARFEAKSPKGRIWLEDLSKTAAPGASV